MSDFDDLYSDALQQLADVCGDEVFYTPAGGTPVSVVAIVGLESSEEVEDTRGRHIVRRRDVTIRTDEDAPGGGVEVPAENATFTINEVEYAVSGIVMQGNGYCRLQLTRKTISERSRPGYRVR